MSDKDNKTDISLRRDDKGQLVCRVPGSENDVENVRVARCFPWSLRERYISVRNKEGEEICLIESPGQLEDSVRALIEEELGEQEFIPQVTGVWQIDDQFDVTVMKIETDRGPIELQVKDSEDIRTLQKGRVLIKDHAGGIFEVPDVNALDAKSRSLLERYLT